LAVVAGLSALVMAATPAAASVTYTYDNLGRLATATYDDGVTVTYTYDENGNRMIQAVTTSSGGAVWGSFTWGSASWTASGGP
jgi:YD repeat-containing protein